MGADGDVGVPDEGGRNQDGGAGGEADDKAEIPEDQVAAEVRVEASEGCDGAPAPGQIAKVEVGDGECARAKVKGAGSEDAAHEVGAEGEVFGQEQAHLRLVERKQQWCPKSEEDCGDIRGWCR